MEALLTVSALSQPTVSIIESAMGSPDRATEGLAMASLAGLIEESGGRVRFTHPLYKSVVYADAAVEERRRLHRQLAEIVSDPEECARHMAVGADGPDDAVAEALEKAAGQAASRGATSAAAELAELALRLTPPDQSESAFRRGLVAGDHLFDAGDAGRARSMFEELAGGAPLGVRRAEVLCRLATIRAHQDNWSGAQQLFEEALKEAGPDERTRASIGRDLAWVGLMRGSFAQAASQAQAALELAERVDDASLLSEVLTVVGFADFTRGQGRPMELLERAVDLAKWGQGPRVMPHPGFMIGILLKWSDRLDEARERFELVLRQARERGDEGPLPYFLYHLAELECWAGNWERASAHAREGYESMLQTGQDSMVTVALYAKGLIDAHLGRIDEAREAASIGLAQAERRDASIRRIQNLGVLGFVDLSIGEADSAAARLELADALSAQAGAGEPGIFRYQGDLIEALVTTGKLDRAESVVATLEAQGKVLNRTLARGVAARGRALLAAAVGDLPTAIRSAQEALGHHEALGQPFELARTLVVVGEVQRRDKDKGAARTSLQRACSIFEQLGASIWCRRAQNELARTGGRTDGPGKLTETEHQVAVLVAAGKTNPEVADILFMSRKTVESNLSRIYHKLGIRNRFELARRLAETDQA
jgi:DNA-binding CsgD family transcriptional regulator